MSEFVESLKRLYQNGLLETVRIILLFDNGKITEEEKDYILNAR